MMMRLKEQQSGFAMIEALIAAVLLVIVTLGVLLGLDAAQRSSGREKSRSVAAALTEQDQERLRSFRAVDLDNYDQTRTVKVNKIPYVITSQADWVRDSTGGTESCNSNTVQADYMRVTSTTTSGLINSPIAPIKMSSLVAPPIGAFGANQGTLGVQVNNRDGLGVAGIPVTITGPSTLSNPTNSAGCAIFAYVPVGSYNASVTQTGWVDQGGNATAQKGATVANGAVNVTTLAYDNAASVAVTFDTETLSGAKPFVSSTQVALSNSGVPSGPFSPFAGLRVVDPAGGAALSITATGLFPFADGYGVYGGGCPGADPTKYISNYYALNPTDFIDTDPGLASPPVTVRLPSINLRVMYGASAIPLTSLPHITAISKSTNCSEKFTYTSTLVPVAPVTDVSGYMLTSALPFGDYDVCVDAIKPLSVPPARITKSLSVANGNVVKNRFAEGIKPPSTTASPVIDLNSGTTNGTCP
jgi:Tfp pilus assembly protein PilV